MAWAAHSMTASRLSQGILATLALACVSIGMLGGVSAFASDAETSPVFDDRRLNSPSGLACFGGKLYVANSGADSVTIYAAKARGKVAAIDGISGLNTKLDGARAIAVDSAGRIYVANAGNRQEGGGSITVYAPGSSGSVDPIVTIEGDKTRVDSPAGLAVDSAGNIFVANEGPRLGHGYVTVYSPGSTGNADPVKTLEGPATGLDKPAGVAVDPAGYVYVTNFHADPGYSAQLGVKIFAPDGRGDATPIVSIDGSAPWVDASGAAALDPKGDLYVAGLSAEMKDDASIGLVYRDPRYDNVGNYSLLLKPGISGSKTGLAELSGLAVDPAGRIYAANPQANSISVFAAGATGDVAPIAKIENPAKPPPLASDALLRKLPWTIANIKRLRALTKAAVYRFSQTQEGSELDEMDPSFYATFEIGWYPAGGGNYELAIVSQSGPDVGYTTIFWKTASGKVTSQDFGSVAYGGSEEWYRGPFFADLNGDGSEEIIDFSAINPSSKGLDHGKFVADPSWPQVYRLENGRYVEDSRAFASFYEKVVLPQLAEAIVEAQKRVQEVAAEKAKPPSASMPQPSPPYDSFWFQPSRYLAALIACRDKILRLLGRDPNAGLEQAREWMKSPDPFIVDDARITFEDIGGHQKEADEAHAATKIAIERWPDKGVLWYWSSSTTPIQK